MGTNYYAVRVKPTVAEPIHIGKSSAGWLFLFTEQNKPWAEPECVWCTFPQVKAWLQKYVVDKKEYVILDEYDNEISLDALLTMIEDKQNNEICKSNPDNFNYSRNVDGYRFSRNNFE